MASKMRISVLASGSSGNACYIETPNTRILVDAGLSCKEILNRLEIIGVEGESLDALIVTHEHSDHLKGAGPLCRKFDLPLFTNHKTMNKSMRALGNISKPMIIQTGQCWTLNDLSIETFTKCHDAADPLGLVLSCDGIRLGIATDLGRSTRLVEDRLSGCQALVLEFNYDPVMLDEGPYPLDLKRRIKGKDGHLSNQQAGELLHEVLTEAAEMVIMAHLSETNNLPEKAREVASRVLEKKRRSRVKILTSKQDKPTPIVEL